MSETRAALFELGTEELPPRYQDSLREALKAGVVAELEDANLPFGRAVQAYASSRRLALRISAVAARTDALAETRKGPAVAAAFDSEGRPTRALLGFAKGCGTDAEQMRRWKDGKDRLRSGKGEWLAFERTTEPRDCREVLPGALDRAVAGLPLPKRMRWGAREVAFLRPVRWVVLLYGDEPVEGEVLGLACGATTRGHRFLGERLLDLVDADSYEEVLRERGRVLVDGAERRRETERQLSEIEIETGASAVRTESLLEEVCASVEFPVVVAGRVDEEFLDLPWEVVRAVLEDQQKYFSTRTADGAPSRIFLAVANVPDVNGDVRAGCERVARSRLQDAAFYLERDRSRPLESRVEDLGRVVFHRELGTLLDRVRRIGRLALHIVRESGADVSERVVERAARLCKADLGTDIVQSFPKLQGIMGAWYAKMEGEEEAVCAAISDHYLPRRADDALPGALPGLALALADRLDMLVGVFSIGETPTGTRDPLGVRRAAYGVLRLTVERDLDLDLEDCLARAAEGYPESLDPAAPRATLKYLEDRMRGYVVERGLSRDVAEAALATGFARPLDAFRRARAVEEFRLRPRARSLIETHKRIRNILREADGIDGAVDPDLLEEAAERALWTRFETARDQSLERRVERRYERALDALVELAEPVSKFFDSVLVMAEDEKLRHNRLRLLRKIRESFLEIADISCLRD